MDDFHTSLIQRASRTQYQFPVSLINGMQTMLSATVPSDNNHHAYAITGVVVVTTNETGGQVNLNYTCGGLSYALQQVAAGQVVGRYPFSTIIIADPASTVSIFQYSALTGGAANLSAMIIPVLV